MCSKVRLHHAQLTLTMGYRTLFPHSYWRDLACCSCEIDTELTDDDTEFTACIKYILVYYRR